MIIQNATVAIIGGGPGGLTLARLLQLKGVSVKVYERDINKEARIQGGALDLHSDSGLAALKKAGLMNEFKANFRPGAELVRVLDNQANIHSDQHIESHHLKFGDKGYRPEIDRGPLRDILLHSLQPNTVVWNKHFLSIEQKKGKWMINFESGDAAFADIVIGADGANSKTRLFVTGIKPLWTGITMIEGSVEDAEKTAPNIHKLLKGGKIFAYGNEKTLLISSKDNGSFGFAASHKTNEFWDKQSGIDFNASKQVLAWFKKEYSEWGNVWQELFENDKTHFISRPQYCMPLNQKWKAKSNITLIGDAAHWMPPFAGEGVNMAMLDALELSEALTNPALTDTQKCISTSEKKMFKRFSKIGQATLFNTEWMHQPHALENMLSMFSKNKLKQGLFVARYFVNVSVHPFIRKAVGLPPKQNVLSINEKKAADITESITRDAIRIG